MWQVTESSWGPLSFCTQVTWGALHVCRVATRGQQVPGSGLPPPSRSRRAGFREAGLSQCPAGTWLLVGWKEDEELGSSLGQPSWLLMVIGPQPAPSTESPVPACNSGSVPGLAPPTSYPNLGGASQALPSPAPGCRSPCSVRGLLPSPTPMPDFPFLLIKRRSGGECQVERAGQ